MFLGYILRERDNLIQGKKFIFLKISKKVVNLCASECVSLPRVKLIKKNQLLLHTVRLVASITLHLYPGIKTERVMKMGDTAFAAEMHYPCTTEGNLNLH